MSSLKLTRLLEAQVKFTSPLSLSKNFGDSYLVKHNRIFAKIRESVVANGYSYSNKVNEAYLALSLSQLENILESKTLPYLDNVSVLEKINSNAEIFWDDISDNLRKNYVFHESCHAIARSLGSGFFKDVRPEEKLLRILLEESFANACELVAVRDAKDQLHRIFYEWNSYTFLFEECTHLSKAIEDLGAKSIFKFFILTYLRANFLAPETNEKDFSRTLALAFGETISDPKKIKTLRYLSRIGFTLDQRFREVTTGLHLRLCGFQKSREELLNFDFLSVIEKKNNLQDFISSLTSAAVPENF